MRLELVKLGDTKKIVFFTDCISIDPVGVPENERYPGMIAEAYPDIEMVVDGSCGATTEEAVAKVATIIEMKPDVVIFGYGLNDALPRGLHRYQRAAIIRSMYSLKLNNQLRLMARSVFLNPLEFVMQIVAKPKNYFSVDQMIANMDFCIQEMMKQGIRVIVVNINPVGNYRFIHAQKFVEVYNQAISSYCEQNKLPLVDVFELFKNYKYSEVLSEDKFHYSFLGHQLVAAKLKSTIDKITKG